MRPVASMLPHEEVISSHVEGVAAEISRERVQRDPIIVDSDSGTVLDGMHRLAAFRKLGLANAVCCPVDYASKGIGLHRWARVYSLGDRRGISARLHDAGITRASTPSEAFAALESRSCGVAAFTSQEALLPEGGGDLSGGLAIIRRVDSIALSFGWTREFVPDDEVDVALQDDRKLVLLVQRLGKDDVVGAARSGRLFPCKTSMHAIDPRPVAVDLPLEELDSMTGADLRRRLNASGGELLPAGSQYHGRRYKERLLVLSGA